MSEKNAQAEAPSEREALTAVFLQAMEWGRDYWSSFSMRGHDQQEIAEQFADKARAALATQQAGQGEAVAQGWTPTPENINRLPAAVRSYIHELAANADPAGNVRDLTIARDTVRALASSNRALRDLDTPGNRHPEFRFAGYAGEPLPEKYTEDQHAAYDEGVRARSAALTPPAPQQAEALAQQERDALMTLFTFMQTAFVPMTSQQEEIRKQLDITAAAIRAARSSEGGEQ